MTMKLADTALTNPSPTLSTPLPSCAKVDGAEIQCEIWSRAARTATWVSASRWANQSECGTCSTAAGIARMSWKTCETTCGSTKTKNTIITIAKPQNTI